MSERWREMTLGDVCGGSGQYGYTTSASESPKSAQSLKFVRTTDIVKEQLDWGSVPFCEEDPSDREKYLLRSGDVLISRMGTVGVSAFVTDPPPAVFASYLVRFRPDPVVADARYIGHLVRSPQWWSYVEGVRGGSVQPNLNARLMAGFSFVLPPLAEQRRIAGVLGAFDDLIDSLHVGQAQLDELARSTFLARWDGSTRSRLADIGDLTMGQSPPGSTYNESGDGLPFYQGVRDFGDRYPTERVYCSAPTRVAEAGDVLIAVRAPIGSTNVATSTLAIGRGLAALRATSPSTAFHAIRSDRSLWNPFEGEGTVFSSINGPTLRNVAVPWVDDPDLESHLRALDDLHRAYAEDVERIAGARDELLPLLMSGRITVDEAWEAAVS